MVFDLMGDEDEIDESDFDLRLGRFRGEDGEIVEGSPPEDYDSVADRYRAEDGRFKDRSKDLLDEPEERLLDIDPRLVED